MPAATPQAARVCLGWGKAAQEAIGRAPRLCLSKGHPSFTRKVGNWQFFGNKGAMRCQPTVLYWLFPMCWCPGLPSNGQTKTSQKEEPFRTFFWTPFCVICHVFLDLSFRTRCVHIPLMMAKCRFFVSFRMQHATPQHSAYLLPFATLSQTPPDSPPNPHLSPLVATGLALFARERKREWVRGGNVWGIGLVCAGENNRGRDRWGRKIQYGSSLGAMIRILNESIILVSLFSLVAPVRLHFVDSAFWFNPPLCTLRALPRPPHPPPPLLGVAPGACFKAEATPSFVGVGGGGDGVGWSPTQKLVGGGGGRQPAAFSHRQLFWPPGAGPPPLQRWLQGTLAAPPRPPRRLRRRHRRRRPRHPPSPLQRAPRRPGLFTL